MNKILIDKLVLFSLRDCFRTVDISPEISNQFLKKMHPVFTEIISFLIEKAEEIYDLVDPKLTVKK